MSMHMAAAMVAVCASARHHSWETTKRSKKTLKHTVAHWLKIVEKTIRLIILNSRVRRENVCSQAKVSVSIAASCVVRSRPALLLFLRTGLNRAAAAKREAEGVVLYVHVPCLLCVYTTVHVCARVIIINVDFQKPGNGKQNKAWQRSANGKKIVAQQQRLQRPQRRW